MADNAPPALIVNPRTLSLRPSETYRNLFEGNIAIMVGFEPAPVETSVPTFVIAPVAALMEKTEIVPSAEFGTYRKAPAGSIAGKPGVLAAPLPVETAVPSDVREPSGFVLNGLIVPSERLVTYTYLPAASSAIPTGKVPTANGEPVIGVRLPSKAVVSVAKATTFPLVSTI